MDDKKRCSKCKIEKVLINFHTRKITKHGLNSIYESCMDEYYLNISIKLNQKQKDCYSKNHDPIRHYKK